MTEPTQEQRDEAWRLTYTFEGIQQKHSGSREFESYLALIQQRDALKAENERLKKSHSEDHFCCNEVPRLKAELAVVKRDHGQAILRGQAEREAKEEAQRKLKGLAEAQRQLNCDRDVELTNLRARVEQLREELTRAYKNGDAMVLEAHARLARVERERDQYRVLANMAECEMQQARARVSKLEEALRNLISHHKHPPMKCGPGVGECDEVRAARRLIDEPTEDELYRETPEPH